MRLAALALIACLAGCQTYKLDDEWSPLTTVVERPKLPFGSNTATVTVAPYVYTTDLEGWLVKNPPGSVEFRALMLHEREHGRRQFRYEGLTGELSKAAWLARYGLDKKFRWEEEQAGYYLQIKHLQQYMAWNQQRTLNTAAAMSKTYEGMVSFDQAVAWIEDVLAGRWEPE